MISGLLEEHLVSSFPLRVGMIGTRKLSSKRALEVADNASLAASHGYTLVSGGAAGTDQAAEEAFKRVADNTPRIIFRPTHAEMLPDDDRLFFYEIAEKCHPNWSAVVAKGPYVTNLMVRNAMIVYYSDIILAWPAPGRIGGTEHGIACAGYLHRKIEVML